MNVWICTKDQLPKRDQGRVLVCYVGLDLECGYGTEITIAEYVFDYHHQYPYWMELPKPPNTDTPIPA